MAFQWLSDSDRVVVYRDGTHCSPAGPAAGPAPDHRAGRTLLADLAALGVIAAVLALVVLIAWLT